MRLPDLTEEEKALRECFAHTITIHRFQLAELEAKYAMENCPPHMLGELSRARVLCSRAELNLDRFDLKCIRARCKHTLVVGNHCQYCDELVT
jgi:hypothetical protein